MTGGLSLVVLADWYNEERIEKENIFDKNTQKSGCSFCSRRSTAWSDPCCCSWWKPISGGANLPALNALLARFGVEFGAHIFSGPFTLNGRSLHYGCHTVSFDPLLYWTLTLPRRSGTCLRRVPARSLVLRTNRLSALTRQPLPDQASIPILALLHSNRSNPVSGRIAVYGDSNVADDANAVASQLGPWLVERMVE